MYDAETYFSANFMIEIGYENRFYTPRGREKIEDLMRSCLLFAC